MNMERNKYLLIGNRQAMKAGYNVGGVYGISTLPIFI